VDKLSKIGWFALLIAMAGDLIVSLLFPAFCNGYNILAS
jgi:hypothetical protein